MTTIKAETLGKALDEAAARFPDSQAIVFKGQRITFLALQQEVNRLAKGLLALGIKKGDHVAIWMGNRPEWLFMEHAVAKLGAVLVRVNTRNRIHETEYVLNHSDAGTLVLADQFLHNDFIGMLREMAPELSHCKPGELTSARLPNLSRVICLAEQSQAGTFSYQDVVDRGRDVPDEALAKMQRAVEGGDVMTIIYTSGSTGLPKGVMLTYDNALRHMMVVADWMKIRTGDRMFFASPLFYLYGVAATGTAVATASAICLLEAFEPLEALRMIQDERCTVIYGVPTMFIMMLEHPDFDGYDTGSCRTGLIGGAASAVELTQAIVQKMGVRELVSGYGLTECCGCQTGTRPEDAPELIATTVGVQLPDNEVAVFDPETGARLGPGEQGEIRVRGQVVMKGYFKNPEETTNVVDAEGWLRTGDLGMHDRNGYFRITGRLKDMFVIGGANAYPAEIENFLYGHPKVKQVYVVGVPDHRLGEVGMAFVELKDGQSSTAEEIINFCKGKLANYKVPRYVKFTSEFPMTASGKVQKFVLREAAIAELSLKKETFF